MAAAQTVRAAQATVAAAKRQRQAQKQGPVLPRTSVAIDPTLILRSAGVSVDPYHIDMTTGLEHLCPNPERSTMPDEDDDGLPFADMREPEHNHDITRCVQSKHVHQPAHPQIGTQNDT